MKEYIKPSINNLEVESSAIMVSSMDKLDLGQSPAGTAGASTARSKRHNDSLWNLSWDDEEEEEENN